MTAAFNRQGAKDAKDAKICHEEARRRAEMPEDFPRRGPRFQEIRNRAAGLNVPLCALWEITHRCPLRCRHCYLSDRREEDELATTEAKDLLRELARLGVMFLTFTGGEPLLRDDIFELVDEARSLGFAWKLLTGGTLADDEKARRIAERSPLEISVSLHGVEETHDMLTTVPGSFRAAVQAIERLTGMGVRVIVKTSLTPQGLKDVGALREMCARLGVFLAVSTAMFPDVEGNPVDESLRLSDEGLRAYLSDCAHLHVWRSDRDPSGPVCGAGRSALSVSPRGDVRACVALRRVCGNVREVSLREIWQSEAMAEARRFTSSSPRECRGCGSATFCAFCPGLAEAETGDALSPPPSICREARIRRELWEGEAREGSSAGPAPAADCSGQNSCAAQRRGSALDQPAEE